MNLTMKTLSALAIAATAFAAAAATTDASATSPAAGRIVQAGGTLKKLGGLTLNSGILHKLPPGTFKCLVCTLPHPKPYPHPTHGWGHGWGHGWYGWHHGPGIIAIGAPIGVAAPVGAPSAPVRVSAPAPQAAANPCSCLTKQQLPDGSVLFQDICTKESAIEAPEQIGAR